MTQGIEYNKNTYNRTGYNINDANNDDDDYRESIRPVFTSKNQKKIKRTELNREINNKKDIIRNMIHLKLGNSIMLNKNRPTKKPPVLQRFELGLREYLFGKKGIILDYFPSLKKELMLEDIHKKHRIFDIKIKAGESVYFNYQIGGNQYEQRMIDIKRNALIKSKHFDINKMNTNIYNNNNNAMSKSCYTTAYTLPTKNMISKINNNNQNNKISHTRNTNISNTTAYAPNKKMIDYFHCNTTTSQNTINDKNNNTTSSAIVNNDSLTMAITPYSNKNLKLGNATKRTYSRCTGKDWSVNDYPTIANTTPFNNHNNSHNNIKKRDILNHSKAVKKKIIIKANLLNQTQIKLEKKLFRIIDKAHTTHKKNIFIDKDIETIFGTKLKKQNSKGQTKELYFKAVQVKNDLRCMESNKADLLRLSDTINNMTDEMALGLADRLVEEYWKKSIKANLDFVTVPEIIKKKRERQAIQLRNRISNNNCKLVRKKHELIHQKNELIELLNDELSIPNKYSSPF